MARPSPSRQWNTTSWFVKALSSVWHGHVTRLTQQPSLATRQHGFAFYVSSNSKSSALHDNSQLLNMFKQKLKTSFFIFSHSDNNKHHPVPMMNFFRYFGAVHKCPDLNITYQKYITWKHPNSAAVKTIQLNTLTNRVHFQYSSLACQV